MNGEILPGRCMCVDDLGFEKNLRGTGSPWRADRFGHLKKKKNQCIPKYNEAPNEGTG